MDKPSLPPNLLAILQLALQLLSIHQLPTRLHKVLLQDIIPPRPDSKQTRLRAHISNVCTIKPVRELYDALVVNLASLGDRSYWGEGGREGGREGRRKEG